MEFDFLICIMGFMNEWFLEFNLTKRMIFR